jgi:uncharacterized membrane protein YeaQ/YmgE (transglycosylase-associated protein family)
MSQASQPPDPLSLSSIVDKQERTQRNLDAVTTQLKLIPRMIFMLCILASACLAASVTPLLRRRMGLLTSAVHGLTGVVVASIIVGAVMDGPFGGPAQLVLSCLFCSVVGQLVFAVFRLYAPSTGGGGGGASGGGSGKHLHRWSPGEPWPWLVWLYVLVFRRFAGKAHAVSMVAEPALLLVIALALALVEPAAPAGTSAAATGLGVWCWPALGALGCLLHAAALRTREAWRIQVLLDHEMDQEGLSQSLAGRSIASALREAEGVASIGPDGDEGDDGARLHDALRRCRAAMIGVAARSKSIAARVRTLRARAMRAEDRS